MSDFEEYIKQGEPEKKYQIEFYKSDEVRDFFNNKILMSFFEKKLYFWGFKSVSPIK